VHAATRGLGRVQLRADYLVQVAGTRLVFVDEGLELADVSAAMAGALVVEVALRGKKEWLSSWYQSA
jgi:hypothetical protein